MRTRMIHTSRFDYGDRRFPTVWVGQWSLRTPEVVEFAMSSVHADGKLLL